MSGFLVRIGDALGKVDIFDYGRLIISTEKKPYQALIGSALAVMHHESYKKAIPVFL